ncbi:MAG: bifunctional adenosylcobinamide kinase/adenosylcobinamide-phosphate guanylyltransferase [Thermodesulfobacteriota bacterium]|nr:bifunctional adenosylcobinamide kinase/adenosylcobinamide-phosphate guanylyltransferase [Thermodesulfobacteriota bacterium]
MNRETVFVTGGARSGKSSFAYNLAESMSIHRAYIATAQPLDEEMKERIEKHRKARGPGWDTIEEPIKLVDILSDIKKSYDLVLIDCITLWISNLLGLYDESAEYVLDDVKKLVHVCQGIDCHLIFVSNEVGMGIVPENPLARLFRDISGKTNQMLADISSSAYCMVSGLPLQVK